MAEYSMIDDPYRGSTVFVQPEIEGFLEKKSPGVLRTKTSKRWCSVQGSVFYQQKSSQGPGEIEVIDMSDVQTVKKVTSDTSETQFDIVKKKSHQVFICASREECSAWVKALLTAMTIQDASTRTKKEISSQSSVFYSSHNDKETVNSPTGKVEHSVNNEYSLPQDMLTNDLIDDTDENVYSVIPFEHHNQGEKKLPNHDNTTNNLQPPHKYKESLAQKSKVCKEESDENLYADSCSTGIMNSKTEESVENCYADGYSTGVVRRKSLQNEASNSNGASARLENIEADETETETDNNEDLLQHLFIALDGHLSPVPDLEYNITADDLQPMTELKSFLHDNDISYHSPPGCLSQNEDPISACKSFLNELNKMV